MLLFTIVQRKSTSSVSDGEFNNRRLAHARWRDAHYYFSCCFHQI